MANSNSGDKKDDKMANSNSGDKKDEKK
jgi:hypothetical protein